MILLNFYSSYSSYAQSCLKDFGLKGPVQVCNIEVFDAQESPDGYEYILDNYSSIFNSQTFPFGMWTGADEVVCFDESGRVIAIGLYDAPFRSRGSVLEARIIYEYRNDKLQKVTLFHSSDNGIDQLWIKYGEQGEMTDLYRVINHVIKHYKYTKNVNGDISISMVNNNSMSEIAKIHGNKFLLKVGQKYVNLPYLLNPLSISVLNDMYDLSNLIIRGAEDWYIATTADTSDSKIKEIYKIPFDREKEHFDDAVLIGKIEVNEDNDIVKLNFNNGSYYFKYEDYDEYGNWTSCTRYFAETGIEDILIRRGLAYY